jgi:hypothetical protein
VEAGWWSASLLNGRGDWIQTSDLLNPIQQGGIPAKDAVIQGCEYFPIADKLAD